ncbi:MAG TPA: hypothetical protein ACFCUC_02645 [Desulfobacterales bacterium]
MKVIYNDVFEWEGFGGRLQLAAGRCHLWIFDRGRENARQLAHLRRYVVVAADSPECRLSVKSCVSHIATRVSQRFQIEPQRMLFVEYYPEKTYGPDNANVIPERYDKVEFTWYEDKAMHPKWLPLEPNQLDSVTELMQAAHSS